MLYIVNIIMNLLINHNKLLINKFYLRKKYQPWKEIEKHVFYLFS